jgi:hypothetical protein
METNFIISVAIVFALFVVFIFVTAGLEVKNNKMAKEIARLKGEKELNDIEISILRGILADKAKETRF